MAGRTHLGEDTLPRGGVKVVGQTLEQRSAVYAAGDPNGCPSATQPVVYGWNGSAFVPQRKEQVRN